MHCFPSGIHTEEDLMTTLRIVTYNIHKGYSRRHGVTVHALRKALQTLHGDILFLQEVQGLSEPWAARFAHWPQAPQYEFLADTLWSEFAYGRNAVYQGGHHGNAVLSKFPIADWHNIDISQSRLERRGLLHCRITLPGWVEHLHCINVHFGLLAGWRKRQVRALCEYIDRAVPCGSPLIVAGDFNDWGVHTTRLLPRALGLEEVFEATTGQPARSFPARLPLLRLDRIYTRGFAVHETRVHHGARLAELSDHAALSATLQRTS